jgi:hypothetical protein
VSFPNLFLVGAARAGTTSTWHYLQTHPQIFMSRIKEPHFFSRASVPGLPTVKREDEYLALFAGAGAAAYRGEASVSYLWDNRSAQKIRRAVPHARILVSLRDPVERAYSHYWLYVHLGLERRDFRSAVHEELDSPPDPAAVPPPYVARGLYAGQVERYLNLFEHVHVLFFDDLVADARSTMRGVFEFLSVDPAPADEMEPVQHNAFRAPRSRSLRRAVEEGRRRRLSRLLPFRARLPLARALTAPAPKPALDAETHSLLRGLYADSDRRLGELLGRRLPWA